MNLISGWLKSILVIVSVIVPHDNQGQRQCADLDTLNMGVALHCRWSQWRFTISMHELSTPEAITTSHWKAQEGANYRLDSSQLSHKASNNCQFSWLLMEDWFFCHNNQHTFFSFWQHVLERFCPEGTWLKMYSPLCYSLVVNYNKRLFWQLWIFYINTQ